MKGCGVVYQFVERFSYLEFNCIFLSFVCTAFKLEGMIIHEFKAEGKDICLLKVFVPEYYLPSSSEDRMANTIISWKIRRSLFLGGQKEIFLFSIFRHNFFKFTYHDSKFLIKMTYIHSGNS